MTRRIPTVLFALAAITACIVPPTTIPPAFVGFLALFLLAALFIACAFAMAPSSAVQKKRDSE